MGNKLRPYVESKPDTLFVFGDNVKRRGTSGSAAVRGLYILATPFKTFLAFPILLACASLFFFFSHQFQPSGALSSSV